MPPIRLRVGAPRRAFRRPSLRRLLLALALAGLAPLVAACASGSPNAIAEGHEGAPGVRRVLLAPPNLVLALNAEVQSGARALDREIGSYLESQGRDVERFDLLEGRTLWKRAMAQARAGGSLEGAVGIFVRELARGHQFDVLAMPSLILHQTRMDSCNASWDGVSRRMRITNAPAAGTGREQSDYAKGVAWGGISGPAWVTSVHVLVFARDGSRLFEGRGGVDFLHEVDLLDQGRSFRYELRPNGSLFLDPARVREGVVRAFTPYLIPR